MEWFHVQHLIWHIAKVDPDEFTAFLIEKYWKWIFGVNTGFYSLNDLFDFFLAFFFLFHSCKQFCSPWASPLFLFILTKAKIEIQSDSTKLILSDSLLSIICVLWLNFLFNSNEQWKNKHDCPRIFSRIRIIRAWSIYPTEIAIMNASNFGRQYIYGQKSQGQMNEWINIAC